MTDQQRIHPVTPDMEAPPPPTPTPTRPPMPRRVSFRSEEPDLRTQQVPFTGAIPITSPPLKPDPRTQQVPLTRAVPITPTPLKPPKKSNCSCKCFCWAMGLLILLLIIVGAIVGIIYLVFQPKLPKYSVDNLRISDLTLNFDLSLYARFNVRITAENPNKKIGIYYERGSHLRVWHGNTNLCQGAIPRFYQGHQNKTVLNVALTGQNQYGRTLLEALQEEQQTGRIPLDLKIDVPVRIELGKMKLMKVRILGACKLIVDSLSTDRLISIKASTCSFGVKL